SPKLGSSSIGVGGSTTVDIVLSEVPSSGLSGYELDVSVSGGASISDGGRQAAVSFPPAFADVNSFTLSSDGSSIHIKASDGPNNVTGGETNLTLASLTLVGDSQGSATVSTSITQFQAEDGSALGVTGASSDLTVGTGEGPTASPKLGSSSIGVGGSTTVD
ncbi:MAG: hypothetical protein ABEJ86_01070, partial [Halococcoides sp.]